MRVVSLAALLLAFAQAHGAAPRAAPAAAEPPRASGITAYPDARRTDVADTFHGVVVADPYRWMEDLRAPELAEWIAAQNRSSAPLADDAYYVAARARLTRLADLYPTREPGRDAGGRTFYRDFADDRVRLFVRDSDAATPRVLVDAEPLARDVLKEFLASPDGDRVAYVAGPAGADWNEIRIRDVRTGRDVPPALPNVRFEGPMRWTADGRGLVYRRFAPPRDGRREAPAEDPAIYLHRVGTPIADDVRLHALEDERRDWSLAFDLPGDRRRLFVYAERGPWSDGNLGGSRAAVSVLELDRRGRPRDGATARALLSPDAAYRVIHAKAGRAWVFTDHDAPRRRVVLMDLARPAPAAWVTVIPEGAGVLTRAAWYGGRLVTHSIENVHSVIRVYDERGGRATDVELPGTGIVQEMLGDPSSSRLWMLYSGLLQAPVLLQHDLRSGATKIESVAQGAPDLTAFDVRQEWFVSRDGTRVPMFVVAPRGPPKDRPTILHAYGASGSSQLPTFREDVVAWLQLGGTYAIANVRGGGEFGREWYRAAIRERKQTSFDDLIAAAEHLVAKGWTSPPRLAIAGASNGGLLVTAAMVQRPDLFGAVLADVPVTDAMRRHLSGNGAQQVEQWGTPDDAGVFPALRAYSPLHNVRVGTCHPATLITTSRDDERMPPWHAYKLTAALQHAQACDAPVLLHVRDSGGHGGSLSSWIDGTARQMTFAARRLGLSPAPPAARE